MVIHKRLTTPTDPSKAVLEGIQTLLALSGVPIGEIASTSHGTTLVTNAVIERSGALVGMLVTEGFRDILDMGLERRYDLFDLHLRFPEPLVQRQLRHEVAERILYDGTVAQELALDEVREAIADLVHEHGIEALAVCFLHSYANREHEERVRKLIEDEFPDLYVSTSAEVFSNMREFERWTTTTINAYVQPMFGRYVSALEDHLASLGFAGRLYIMTSSGGSLVPDAARRFPVRSLESGPAAGALMSAHLGRILGLPHILSFDMGGTTAKGALIRDYTPLKKYETEVSRVHDFKHGSGLPVKIPTIDMIEIGAGGGSIVEVDDRGLIRVGPRSAGADPGPACYGRGGEMATLTDANIVLGYLDPAFFLGGEMRLDVAAAEAAISRSVAEPLNLDLARAAWGIHEITNEDVARAFRIHASERGFDYRNSSMVAFGGSGPVHALGIAHTLKIPRAVFPIGTGVMSALGLLVSPLSFELARSHRVALESLSAGQFEAIFAPIVEEASDFLRRAGIADRNIRIRCKLDMRYQGQGYEIEVPLPDGGDTEPRFAALANLFESQYEEVFAVSHLDEALEIVNWKVEAMGPEASLRTGYSLKSAGSDNTELRIRKGTRPAYFPESGGYVDCPVYNRYALSAGAELTGPGLIEERESTCVIGVGDTARIDAHHNLIVEFSM